MLCFYRHACSECLWLLQHSRFKKFERLENIRENLLSERFQNSEAVKRMKENEVVIIITRVYDK